MRLSRFTDISLRALMLLTADPERVIAARALADTLAVPREHLIKCLRALVALDLVTSVRGRSGGYQARPTENGTTLGALIRALEPSMAMAECFEPQSSCPLTGNCRLAGVLLEARERFLDSLDQHSIADLVAADRPALVHLSIGARGNVG